VNLKFVAIHLHVRTGTQIYKSSSVVDMFVAQRHTFSFHS